VQHAIQEIKVAFIENYNQFTINNAQMEEQIPKEFEKILIVQFAMCIEKVLEG
jgi:hypothetical protein